MLIMVIAKPIQLAIVNAVPRYSAGDLAAINEEN